MLKFFKIIGLLEGISYLLLFFNMLVIKNLNIELYKKMLFPIGMTHGILFVVYIVVAVLLKDKYNWSMPKFLKIAVASIIPFGTFYSEKKWLNEEN